MNNIIFVSGMLRSMSTVTCRIIAQAPNVSNMCCTSPILEAVNGMVTSMNQNNFFRAIPLDGVDKSKRIENMYAGMLERWHDHEDGVVSIEKNRGWMIQIPTLKAIYPDFKMVICLRPLKDICGSIIKNSDKTPMLLSGDAGTMSHQRMAQAALVPNGAIGSLLDPLRILLEEYMMRFDLSDNIYFQTPGTLMDTNSLYDFLGLDRLCLSQFQNMNEIVVDDDAMYNHKFPHSTKPQLAAVSEYEMPQNIINIIDQQYGWYGEFLESLTNKKLEVVA